MGEVGFSGIHSMLSGLTFMFLFVLIFMKKLQSFVDILVERIRNVGPYFALYSLIKTEDYR